MSELVTLPPEEYEGQPLCERCGSDTTGRRYAICADIDPETGEYYCRNGRQYYGLCPPCEASLMAPDPQTAPA
jgi:hypothetical protein